MQSITRVLSSRKTLRRLLVPTVCLAVTGTAMGFFAMDLVRSYSLETETAAERPAPIYERRPWVVAQLTTAGVTPEVLAAAGVPGATVGALVDAASEYCEDHGQALLNAQQALATANSQLRRAQTPSSAVQPPAGNAPAQLQSVDLQTAQAAVAAATVTMDSERRAFLAAALQPLAEDARATLLDIVAHRHWDIPVEYKTLQLTETERLALRDELTAIRQQQADEHQSPRGTAMARPAAHSNDAASVARAHLDANLASVQAAWAQAQVQ